MQYIEASRTGNIDHIVLHEKWEVMVRRQDGRTGGQALADDTKRAMMIDTCPVQLERHLVLNPDRYDTDPKIKSAVREYVEQMRHEADPVDTNKNSYPIEEEHDGEWEQVYTIGDFKGEGNKGKSDGKGKDGGKRACLGAGKCHPGKPWGQGDADYFPFKDHYCGNKATRPRSAPRTRQLVVEQGRLWS